ncbi:hypothetical protein OIU85_005751 [Salix viminalis]|uniref:Uncharacterized protein n=1 Tax=Salix viminalis TaxID=40686 RepID=A0A9Q0PJL1_SALVM|nr:hypothetical protein OIU85_005751 [Salix viminalis]
MKWEGLGTNYDLNKSFDHTCRGDESVTVDYVSSEEQSEAGPFRKQKPKAKNIYILMEPTMVTILVAAKGVYQVPAIRSTEDMKGALRSLNVDAKELEVDENDTLPEQEFLGLKREVCPVQARVATRSMPYPSVEIYHTRLIV